MTTPQISATINHRVNKLENINWRELQFIQHEEFKELPKSSRDKLKQSLIKHDFSDPFKVWHDTSQNITYCLDGKHRTLLLEELIKDGVEVPEMLPAVFIECSDIKAAAKLVLVYSSVYAKITEQGSFEMVFCPKGKPLKMKLTVYVTVHRTGLNNIS